MAITRTMTEAALAQRRKNSADIAARKRAKETCQRGHSRWAVSASGKRSCMDCANDRTHYYRLGIERPDDRP